MAETIESAQLNALRLAGGNYTDKERRLLASIPL